MTREVEFCDICQEREACYTCLQCAAVCCEQCAKSEMRHYQAKVHGSTWADGRFCLFCHDALLHAMDDPVWLAYRRIEEIREQIYAFHASVEKDTEEAERRLLELRHELGKDG